METNSNIIIATETRTKVKSSYSFLTELCSFNADFNAFTPRINPITNRVQYIINQLRNMGLIFEVDIFNAKDPEKLNLSSNKFVNVYVLFKGRINETVILSAHHDVSNLESENCQDNTASVCNLLHLCGLLKQEISKGLVLEHNVLIAFTDAEEIVSPTTCGARRLSILSKPTLEMFGKVKSVFNLELTANGNSLWVSTAQNKEFALETCVRYNGQMVRTPFNDSYTFEKSGLRSICIGTLTQNELNTAIKKDFCKTWGLCHSFEDTTDNANEQDMTSFVENVLMKMATNI